MEKRIQCLSNASQHVPIYLEPFTSYSEIMVGNCNFSYPLHLTPPLRVFPLEFREKFGPQKTRIMGLPGSEDSLTISRAVSTQYQRVTDRWTDGRTDGQSDVDYISNVRSMTNVKKLKVLYFTYLHRSPRGRMCTKIIWHRASPPRCNILCQILCRSVQGFLFCRGSKFAILH